MNNDIKEILDRAKNLKYKCDCCEEIEPGKYVMRDDKQTDNLIEAVYIIDKLLDYITNLQEENERLKNGYCELKVKCNNGECDCTNEEYDGMAESNMKLSLEIARLNNIIIIMEKYLELIFDIGFDYDGCGNVQDLKALIDEMVRFASLGRAYNTTEKIYVDSKGKSFNILGEELKQDNE